MQTRFFSRRKETAAGILFTLAAILAVSGILSLFPKQTPQTPEIEETIQLTGQETAEVFSIANTEAACDLFQNFIAPVSGPITSDYGYRSDPFSGETSYHRGVDIGVKKGTEVQAAEAGTVIASVYNSIGGNYVLLSHENGTQSYYGHLQTRLVSKGDTVAQGDVIGLSGDTGMVTGPHLHFQLTYNDRTVDPLRYIEIAG